MNEQIKRSVISLLERYPDTMRKIAVLRYELEHPATISPDEMIGAMSFARGDGEGRPAGHISNKTLYIAMNYQTKAAQENRGTMDEVARRLLPLEHEVRRLEHHLALLPERERTVIRLHYFAQLPWEDIGKELDMTRRTAQTTLKLAVDHLVELYELVSGLEQESF